MKSILTTYVEYSIKSECGSWTARVGDWVQFIGYASQPHHIVNMDQTNVWFLHKDKNQPFAVSKVSCNKRFKCIERPTNPSFLPPSYRE